MRPVVGLIVAGGDLEAIKGAVESLRAYGDTVEIKVLYYLFQRGIQSWCEKENIWADYYGGDKEGICPALKRVMTEISSKDIFLMGAEMRCLPCAVERLQSALYGQEGAGAVCSDIVTTDVIAGRRYFKDLSDYAAKQRHGSTMRTVDINWRGVLINGEFLGKMELDGGFLTPDSMLLDMAVQGTEKGFGFYQVDTAMLEATSMESFVWDTEEAGQRDYHYMEEKWHMGYLLRKPNDELLQFLQKDKPHFRLLEVGCASGTNLMQIGNLFPEAQLFGLEINSHSARMAAAFAEVKVGNIEERNLDFGDILFDYIIFGDVLEHLRDPQGTLEYCRTLLSPGGKIIASIPNLMHWSVMKQLVNGFFPYADYGLLDRTHIHFFTYYEMIKMFEEAGYKIKDVAVRKMTAPDEDTRNFVEGLMSITEEAEEFMFWAFQYIILAEKK